MASHCSIWLTPADDDQAYLQNMIRGLSSEHKAPVFSPHCTLYSPADLAKSELEEILEHVSEGILPLTVMVDKLNFTSNIWRTVFIELEKSRELAWLQQKLVRRIPSPKQYDFAPHISLIYSAMPTEKKKGIIEKLPLMNSYKMDKISAVETGLDVMNWKNIAEVKLHA